MGTRLTTRILGPLLAAALLVGWTPLTSETAHADPQCTWVEDLVCVPFVNVGILGLPDGMEFVVLLNHVPPIVTMCSVGTYVRPGTGADAGTGCNVPVTVKLEAHVNLFSGDALIAWADDDCGAPCYCLPSPQFPPVYCAKTAAFAMANAPCLASCRSMGIHRIFFPVGGTLVSGDDSCQIASDNPLVVECYTSSG